MKKITTLSLVLLSGHLLASANIKFPGQTTEGFENVNKRKEYSYYGYQDEKIWHEFGRPFWRKEKKAAVKEQVIKQTTTEKRASTLRKLSKTYNPKTKTLTLDVKFELNRADIQTSYTNEIDQLGRALKENKSLAIEVQGHTDTTGSRAYNMDLSSNRADAVRAYLIKKFDIKPTRIISRGYGPTQPMTSNETRMGREQNRRVDIKVIR